MTEVEILKLSSDELRIKAAELVGLKPYVQTPEMLARFPLADIKATTCIVGGKFMGIEINGRTYAVSDYLTDMNAAMTLFDEVYNPLSKIRHGAWVLSTVDEGKDCALATLFFGAPSRRARRQGRKNRPLKAQAKAKKKQMARAITLCYVMAMEGATVDLRYQPEEE